MRGTFDKASGYNGAPTYSYDEPTGYCRTPFGLRPTEAKLREVRIALILRALGIAAIIGLVVAYMV
jgi:hypothetical protein